MNPFSFKRRVSFQAKVLIPVVAVMTLLTAAAMWLVNHRFSEQLRRQTGEQLDTADKIFDQIVENRANELPAKYRLLLNEPRFKAVTRGTDFETQRQFFADLIQELIQEENVTVCTLTFLKDEGQRGQRVVPASRNPHLSTDEFTAKCAPAVKQAAEGDPKVDTIRVGASLFHIVSMPVGSGDQVPAVLTFGVEIGAVEAEQIRQFTRSEIVFVADGQIAASSLANAESHPELITKFNELTAVAPAHRAQSNRELLLDRQHYLCRAGHFTSLSGDTKIGYLLVLSYEPGWLVLKATQRMFMIVGLLGIACGTAIIWLLVGRVTQPLRQLRDSAEAVGRSDFSHRVDVASRDECGELARAFNKMTENIKTSRDELEKTVETLKTTQHQLIQSEKLSGIGEFVAGVAHELNNPLTSVMGFAELLQQTDLPEQNRRYLDVIFKSAKRCQKIVQSLLSFARRHAPERKVVSLNEIIESAVEILQYQMRTSNIEVAQQLNPNLPAVEVDPHQMQQVFLNIINNARQAMEGHRSEGLLRITTESADGRVRASFQDNGPGITPENMKKIFNPFFTTKEVGKGTGLGLSLCYGIVTEHGGTITPHSTVGEGTKFVIDIPVASAAATDKKATVPAPAPALRDGSGKRVLVIDDEDTILQMIREALTMNGFKVDVARDGESALRRLGQYHYDLALCDWKMPGLGGQQVFERLQASNPDMSRRLIFITGDVVNEKAQEFLRNCDKVCLSKPFTLGEFRTAINRVMMPG
jgi:signal transduction histidine kinase